MCLILSKKPSFANFKLLANESDFLNRYIKPYDPQSTSDYVINELRNYVENSYFAPEKISLINKFSGAMCNWIIIVYEIANANKVKVIREISHLTFICLF